MSVVVQEIERADAATIDALGRAGVAMGPEAQGGTGWLAPYPRPIWAGARIAGSAVAISAPPGDTWMPHVVIETPGVDDILAPSPISPCTDGHFGDLRAISAMAQGGRGPVIQAGLRDVVELEVMGLPIWSKAIGAPGAVEATPGSVHVPLVCGGRAIEAGDVIMTDDDGIRMARGVEAAAMLARASARFAVEECRRARGGSGGLGFMPCAPGGRRRAWPCLIPRSTAAAAYGRAGGTAKGACLPASDPPSDASARDDLFLRIIGSPDPTRIDGTGGANPLTSRAAVLSPSTRADADVDGLFPQVSVDRPVVSDARGCGAIQAGAGPAAIERGLAATAGEETRVRIHMVDTGEVATATIAAPGGWMRHAAILLVFEGLADSICGEGLPRGARWTRTAASPGRSSNTARPV